MGFLILFPRPQTMPAPITSQATPERVSFAAGVQIGYSPTPQQQGAIGANEGAPPGGGGPPPPPPPGGNPPGGGCFIASTAIAVPEGTRPIEAFAPGDEVLAFDFARGLVLSEVEYVARHEGVDARKVIAVGTPEGALVGTPEHLVWTGSHWEGLGSADTLRLATGGVVTVSERSALPKKVSVYNLHLAHDSHLYVAGGFVVHNIKIP